MLRPFAPVSDKTPDIILPDDLDQYLRESEAEVPGLDFALAKSIIWANTESKQQTPLSVVYIHGFTASLQETRPLCDIVAAELSANLFYTRMTGHGSGADSMGQAVVNDWLCDVHEAVEIGRRLGEKIVLVATSTGAAAVLWYLAIKGDKDILATVLMSPNFMPKDAMAKYVTLPWARLPLRFYVGRYLYSEGRNEGHRRYWTRRYHYDALITLMYLVKIVRDLDLSVISGPTLVFYTQRDTVVEHTLIEQRFAEFSSPHARLVEVDESEDPGGHVLAGDVLSPNTTEKVAAMTVDYVRSLCSKKD